MQLVQGRRVAIRVQNSATSQMPGKGVACVQSSQVVKFIKERLSKHRYSDSYHHISTS
jgi:hypothetical protein